MRNLTSVLIAVGAVLAIGLGCSKLAIPGTSNLLEGDDAAQAAAKIKEKVGAEVKVIRLEIRPEKMEVTIQSPKNPKDIDKYTYEKGSVSGPEPVQIMSFGDNEMTGDKYDTTEIGEIGFSAIPETIKQAIEVSKIENAKVDLVSMAYEVPRGGTIGKSKLVFTWRLFVQGPRGRKDFWADKNGKLDEKGF